MLQASTERKWDEKCDKAFKEAKEKLVSAPILAHYDPSKKLNLAANATAYGIGAVHMYLQMGVKDQLPMLQEH